MQALLLATTELPWTSLSTASLKKKGATRPEMRGIWFGLCCRLILEGGAHYTPAAGVIMKGSPTAPRRQSSQYDPRDRA
jgi:hypothetical protein